MKTIYKYKLNPNGTTLELPINAKILSVVSQRDDIVLYALIDNEIKEWNRIYIMVYGTGHKINIDIENYIFLGTVNMYDGQLMFHVFYKWI